MSVKNQEKNRKTAKSPLPYVSTLKTLVLNLPVEFAHIFFLLHSKMEYVLGQRIRRRRERVYRPRLTYLSFSEEECLCKLRLTRQAVTDICHLLADELGTDAPSPYALPVAVKVTAALHFYASGSFQHPISSIGGISQSAISSAIHAVTSGLVRHAGEYIKFPVTPDSQERAKQAFCAKYGFPGDLGCIDCTHVQLRAPSENALVYINRKGTYSINVQVICDAYSKIYSKVSWLEPRLIHTGKLFLSCHLRGESPVGWLAGCKGTMGIR